MNCPTKMVCIGTWDEEPGFGLRVIHEPCTLVGCTTNQQIANTVTGLLQGGQAKVESFLASNVKQGIDYSTSLNTLVAKCAEGVLKNIFPGLSQPSLDVSSCQRSIGENLGLGSTGHVNTFSKATSDINPNPRPGELTLGSSGAPHPGQWMASVRNAATSLIQSDGRGLEDTELTQRRKRLRFTAWTLPAPLGSEGLHTGCVGVEPPNHGITEDEKLIKLHDIFTHEMNTFQMSSSAKSCPPHHWETAVRFHIHASVGAAMLDDWELEYFPADPTTALYQNPTYSVVIGGQTEAPSHVET